jgi:hypothetical protein
MSDFDENAHYEVRQIITSQFLRDVPEQFPLPACMIYLTKIAHAVLPRPPLHPSLSLNYYLKIFTFSLQFLYISIRRGGGE